MISFFPKSIIYYPPKQVVILAILWFWNLFFVSYSFSQTSPGNYYFDKVGEEFGIGSSDLYEIIQDKQGFLWICSANGVFRYDGKNSVRFRSVSKFGNVIHEDFITQILEDSEGNIWAIADGGGLLHFDVSLQQFKRFPIENNHTKAKADIFRIEMDLSGQLYVLKKSKGIFHFNPETQKNIPIQIEGYDFSKVNMMKAGNKPGQIVISTNEIIYLIEKNTNQDSYRMAFDMSLPYPGKTICILVDPDDYIWIGGYYPMILAIDVKKKKMVKYPYLDEKTAAAVTSKNRVNTLCISKDKKIWAGTNSGGVVVLDKKTGDKTHLTHDATFPGSISNNTITKIIEDKSGVIWVTSWGKGLNKYVPQKSAFGAVHVIPQKSGYLQSLQVNCFYESDANTSWIATSNFLHSRDQRTGAIKAFKIPETIHRGNNCQIYSIIASPEIKDELWLGSAVGLIIFNIQTKTFRKWKARFPEEKDLQDEMIYYIDQDDNNNIHVVTYSPYRLFHYVQEKKQFFPDTKIDDLIGDKNVIAILDRQHNFWVGINGQDFFRYPLSRKIVEKLNFSFQDSSSVYIDLGHVYTDPQHRVWFGSKQGLFMFNPKADGTYLVKRLTEENGLPDKFVVGILADQQGFLWVSTLNGLCKINPNTLVCRSYSMADGLLNNEFSFGAYYQSRFRPVVYFGGNYGYNNFNPGDIKDDPIPPTPNITKIQVYKDNSAYIKYWGESGYSNNSPLTFRHDEKIINISFAGTHYADPGKNVFTHRLIGFENQWNKPGHYTTVTYTNLEAGTYTFEVNAGNKDVIWNDKPATITFRVLPPWYRTWWAYLLYFLLIAGLLYYWISLRIDRQRQMMETRRIEELDKLKTRLYANITHEFRTPLTVILGIADQLQKEAGNADRDKIGLIRRNGQSLLDLINQMLELAKLESGGQLVQHVFGDIVSFIEYSLESYQALAFSRQIRIHFEASQRPVNMDYDADKMLRILSNLLSNALKFTPAGGAVTVRVMKNTTTHIQENMESSHCVIEVMDTGIGIPETQIPHVFDRFFQVDETNTRKYEGSGIGLALTKELVHVLGGDIKVKSEVGTGSCFSVSLPITQNSQSVVNASGLPKITPDTRQEPTWTEEESYATVDQEIPLLLVIEDNVDLRDYVKSFLHKDFRLEFAENGAVGVEKALALIPDIIVSDVMMPEMDGFEVLEVLKNDMKTSHVPVIMLTARAAVEDRLSGLKKGADAYMAKPFLEEELLIQIQNLLLSRKKLQEKYSRMSTIQGMEDGKEDEDVFLAQLRSVLEKDLSNADLSMEELSGSLHMSRMQLHRKIKALTGLSTSIYLRNVRLQKAKHLLETTNEQIAAVAYQVGFNDPKYFSRVYQEYFGFSPSDQRKIKS